MSCLLALAAAIVTAIVRPAAGWGECLGAQAFAPAGGGLDGACATGCSGAGPASLVCRLRCASSSAPRIGGGGGRRREARAGPELTVRRGLPATTMAAGADADTPVPTSVELLLPLMPKEQLKRYLRADRSIRTLRAEIPRVFHRPLTGDIYATNVSLGGDILGGTVATGRDEE